MKTQAWATTAGSALLSTTLLVGLAAGIAATVTEAGVARASAAAADMAIHPQSSEDACNAADHAASPRRAVLDALMLSLQINAFHAAGKDCRIDRALGALDDAERGRPGWYETAIVRAYLSAQRQGPAAGADPATTLAAIARSYREARFLRDDGSWRVAYVVRYWDRADPALKSLVTDEAAWLSALSIPMSVHVDLIMIGTPAYEAYTRRRADMLARVSAS